MTLPRPRVPRGGASDERPGLGYKRLALRLKVGEVGVVRAREGYYIVQRID